MQTNEISTLDIIRPSNLQILILKNHDDQINYCFQISTKCDRFPRENIPKNNPYFLKFPK